MKIEGGLTVTFDADDLVERDWDGEKTGEFKIDAGTVRSLVQSELRRMIKEAVRAAFDPAAVHLNSALRARSDPAYRRSGPARDVGRRHPAGYHAGAAVTGGFVELHPGVYVKAAAVVKVESYHGPRGLSCVTLLGDTWAFSPEGPRATLQKIQDALAFGAQL